VIHYELFFFYIAGYRPKDVIRQFGYSRGTAYRFYRIFRLARKNVQGIIDSKISVSPRREKKLKHRDDLKALLPSLTRRELMTLKGNITREMKNEV